MSFVFILQIESLISIVSNVIVNRSFFYNIKSTIHSGAGVYSPIK